MEFKVASTGDGALLAERLILLTNEGETIVGSLVAALTRESF